MGLIHPLIRNPSVYPADQAGSRLTSGVCPVDRETAMAFMVELAEKKKTIRVEAGAEPLDVQILAIDPEALTYRLIPREASNRVVPVLDSGQEIWLAVEHESREVVFNGQLLSRAWGDPWGFIYQFRYPTCYMEHRLRKERRIPIITKNPVVQWKPLVGEPVTGVVLNISPSGFLGLLRDPAHRALFKRDDTWNCGLQLPGRDGRCEEVQAVVRICHVTRSANGFDVEVGCQLITVHNQGWEVVCAFIMSQCP